MDHIIYHSKDLDGITSGALGLIAFQDLKPKLTGYDYGQNFDIRKFKNKKILMVDVSLPMERMFQLGSNSTELIFVDHHQSAFEQFKKLCTEEELLCTSNKINGRITEYSLKEKNILYYYSETLSGCEIMLELYAKPFLFSGNSQRMVRLLGQYDTWRNTFEKQFPNDENWENYVLPFQWGMREKRTPEEVAILLLNYPEKIEFIREMGKSILKYQEAIDTTMLSRNGFEFNLPSKIGDKKSYLKIIALNGGPFNSRTFQSQWHPEVHDAMMPFVYDGNTDTWTFSLYTTKKDIDILSIAKSFGGGGHAQACGFQLKSDQVAFSKNGIEFLIK